jgi:uncharacterized membrane protein YkvA (DUF1232 family)
MSDAENKPVNEAPDSPYTQEYSEDGFWEKMRKYSRHAGTNVVELALQMYFAVCDSNTPRWARMTMIGALGYFIAPLDAVPDLIPAMGFVDDLGVLTAAFATVAISITEEHKTKAREKIRSLFG